MCSESDTWLTAHLHAHIRQLAAERDSVTKVEGKTQFDKKAKSRSFEVGDQVLVMTPSMTGKLDDQWTGPYIIAEKMNEVRNIQSPHSR